MFSSAYQEEVNANQAPVADTHFVATTRRTSVSAECDASSLDAPLPSSQVSDAAVEALSRMFLFRGAECRQIARYLTPREAKMGEVLIRQGDEGDFFYIIEEGEVQFEVDGKKVGSASAGSCFGELALLYNAPRAASVTAVQGCKLWVFSRSTFKSIMVKNRGDKRDHVLKVLESVDLLKGLEQPAKLRLADALQSKQVSAGTNVIVQNTPGDLFYIVEEGQVEFEVNGQKVGTAGPGSYFGELALLDNSPRAATVVAKTALKLEFLNRTGFERLLGSAVVEELKRRDPRK